MKPIIITENCLIYNDMPRGWVKGKNQPKWHQNVYDRWRCMWQRVHDSTRNDFIFYKDCIIHESFRYLSNYLKWIESQSQFKEFCDTCYSIRWDIDKDIKGIGNKKYYPEYMTLCTHTENNSERSLRCDNSFGNSRKPVKAISLKDNSSIYFKSINEAKTKGFNPCNIVNCIKGRQKSHKGYKWEYIEEVQDE